MHGNTIARFDPKTQTFKEWDLPRGSHPHGVLVDNDNTAWYTGNGNGTIGHLECATFIYTRTAYDPEAPIPGGHPRR